MWRLLRASFSVVVIAVGILAGVTFIDANRGVVNVQFPLVARESGNVTLGMALIASALVGVGLALVVAFAAAVGMSLHAAKLKREIKLLRKEVDSLRNLPLLDEEMEREHDEEDDEDILQASRTIDPGTGGRWGARAPDEDSAVGPVRAGSTVASVDDDEDDEDEDSSDGIEAESPPVTPAGGTRKIDIT